jgi:hypothetical protein
MRRGGNWDNSDVKGAAKLEWTDIDKLRLVVLLHFFVDTIFLTYFNCTHTIGAWKFYQNGCDVGVYLHKKCQS